MDATARIPVTTGADLAAQARPLPQADPLKADMASMVPPGAVMLVDELDNASARAAATPEADDEEVAVLDFVGDEPPIVVLPLKYPFRWEGERHDSITVRQLTTGEVGKISAEWVRTGTAPQLIDVYAVMTGLPARVLRALPHTDGDPVMKAGYDFLPPSYRAGDD